jgi:hypothetical protein
MSWEASLLLHKTPKKPRSTDKDRPANVPDRDVPVSGTPGIHARRPPRRDGRQAAAFVLDLVNPQVEG